MIDAILAEKGFALENHQRHAPMARGLLGGFIGRDDGFKARGIGLDGAIKLGEVETGAGRRIL